MMKQVIVLFLNVKTNYTNETTTKNNFRDYSNKNMDKLRGKLAAIDWDFERLENINEKFKYFDNCIHKCFFF